MSVIIRLLLLSCTTPTNDKIQSTLIYFKWLALLYIIKPYCQSILTPLSFLISVQYIKPMASVTLIKNITLPNKIGWPVSI